jgi:amino acid transporter
MIRINKINKVQLNIDREHLRKMGYIQELDRSIGVFSNFALSFSVISILTGLITLYGYSQEGTGIYLFWIWPIVGIFQLIMAICLGEIASCYPVTGGVYKWTNILANRHVGWFNGWISFIGWLACTTGINYGLSQFVLMFLGYSSDAFYPLILTFVIIITIQTSISVIGIKLVTKINDVSVGVHIFGVIGISILIIIFAGNQINWSVISFQSFYNNLPATNYIPALLMSAWTLTAFDASANISEESLNPSRTVPYGMILSVIVSIVFGSLLLFSLGQATMLTNDLSNAHTSIVIYAIENVLGPTLSSFVTLIIIMAMFACGLASQTVTMRIIYAFSRDNGFPFSNLWKMIPNGYETPVFSALLCGILEGVLIIFLGILAIVIPSSPSIMNNGITKSLPTITSLSTVGIYLSYAIVTASSFLQRKKIKNDSGQFRTGKFGYLFNAIAFIWAMTISVVMLFYCNRTTTTFFMLYLVGITIYYFLYMKKILDYRYHELSETELIKIENMRGI